MTQYEHTLYDVSDRVATVTLNRPQKLNAWTRKMGSEVIDCMRRADADDEVRVIVITGAGRGFCAGADMDDLSSLSGSDLAGTDTQELLKRVVPDSDVEGARRDFRRTYSYFPAISKPVIAAVNGAAAGLGFIMMLYCDIRFASDKAKFTTAFSRRGLIAEHGISWMLPRLVGISGALDLLYSARLIKADEALCMGLVSRVVPHEELMATVGAYASELATKVSPRSLKVIKRQVYDALFETLSDAIDVANREMIASFHSEDFREGVAHFVEKRAASFTGR